MECPNYEHDKNFDEYICHSDENEECPEEYRTACRAEIDIHGKYL